MSWSETAAASATWSSSTAQVGNIGGYVQTGYVQTGYVGSGVVDPWDDTTAAARTWSEVAAA